MRSAALVFGGFLMAAAIVLLGPKETTLCTEAAWPNSVFGDQFGHTDGAGFTGCDVPTGFSWALAGAAAVTPLSVCIVLAADRRRL